MLASWLNIANLLTFLRLLAIPFAVQAILRGEHGRALAIVLVAALTDTIDGAVARRFGVATSVGAYFDPIVDKLFLSAVYVSLAVRTGLPPWWLVIEIFARDVLILASSGALMLYGKRRFPPSIWGKASTFLQIALALTLLVNNAFGNIAPTGLVGALFWAVAALTAFSGIHYLWRALRHSSSGSSAAIDGGLARE